MPKYVDIAKNIVGDLVLPKGGYEYMFFGSDFIVERHVDARGVEAEDITLWRGYVGGWFLGEKMKVHHKFELKGVEISGALDLEQAYIGWMFNMGSDSIYREDKALEVRPKVGEDFHAPRLKGGELDFHNLKVGRNLNLSEAKIGILNLSRCEVEGVLSLMNSKVGKLSFFEGKYKALDFRGSKINKFSITGRFPEVGEVLVNSETELPEELVDLLLFYFPDNKDIKRVKVRK